MFIRDNVFKIKKIKESGENKFLLIQSQPSFKKNEIEIYPCTKGDFIRSGGYDRLELDYYNPVVCIWKVKLKTSISERLINKLKFLSQKNFYISLGNLLKVGFYLIPVFVSLYFMDDYYLNNLFVSSFCSNFLIVPFSSNFFIRSCTSGFDIKSTTLWVVKT